MKIKTSDLKGKALDWAVATSQGLNFFEPDLGPPQPNYSENWDLAGPRIDRELINLTTVHDWKEMGWQAYQDTGNNDEYEYGETPLIAAMRIFVHRSMGCYVDVPDSLIELTG